MNLKNSTVIQDLYKHLINPEFKGALCRGSDRFKIWNYRQLPEKPIITAAETLFTLYHFILFRNNSFYVPAFNEIVQGLIEGGFVSYWHEKFLHTEDVKIALSEIPDPVPLTLHNIRGFLYLSLLFYAASILSFFIELIWTKCKILTRNLSFSWFGKCWEKNWKNFIIRKKQ